MKGSILKKNHIMTDKYNCSQIQAIIQSFDKVVRHTCTVVLMRIDALVIDGGLKREKSERKQTWKLNVKRFTPVDV